MDEKKSIWNWEMYQKIKNNKLEITNKIKTFVELISKPNNKI
jgi:hypothetical protein